MLGEPPSARYKRPFRRRNGLHTRAIQTTVYRLEAKNAWRRVKRVGNFHIFEAAISREDAQRRLIDDLLALFGGRPQPVVARLIGCGKPTFDHVKEAEKSLRNPARKDDTQ